MKQKLMKLASAPAGSFIDADRHNFGQLVECIEGVCGTWFRKPRTTHWEYLFFGKESPLRHHFSDQGIIGTRPIADCLFNLEIESSHTWLGKSRKVDSHIAVAPSEGHFYSFGVLLAYSYIFGIRDLHRGNLVMTPTHLQVVDAEVVLTKLVLPHETILLPFKEVTWQQSGIGALVATPDNAIETANAKALLGGFVDLFSSVIESRAEILTTLLNAIDLNAPARVLLRNTVEYNPAAKTPLKHDLLPEELDQLGRGDVPYFFKNIGRPELLWLCAPQESDSVESLGAFAADVERHALSPEVILSEQLVAPHRLAQGLFLIMSKLKLTGEFALRDSTLVSPNKVQFRSVEYKTASK